MIQKNERREREKGAIEGKKKKKSYNILIIIIIVQYCLLMVRQLMLLLLFSICLFFSNHIFNLKIFLFFFFICIHTTKSCIFPVRQLHIEPSLSGSKCIKRSISLYRREYKYNVTISSYYSIQLYFRSFFFALSVVAGLYLFAISLTITKNSNTRKYKN